MLRPGGVLLVNVADVARQGIPRILGVSAGAQSAHEMDDHKMYYDRRDLWPLLVPAGFLPSALRVGTHKFGLNLFAVARAEGFRP